jgi:hypothetical protein
MRHLVLLPLALVGLAGCIAVDDRPPQTTTTYVTPAPTTTYVTPAPSTAYVTPNTTTFIRTP